MWYDILNRTVILVASTNEIVSEREAHDNAIDQDCPVHTRCVRAGNSGEEQEQVCNHQEAACDNIDRQTPSTQAELGSWEFLFAQTLADDGCDDCEVTREEASR